MLTRHLRTLRSSLVAGAALAMMLPFASASAAVYYDYSSKSCANQSGCQVDVYAAVQVGKTLTVERVTCSIRLPKNAVLKNVQLGRWTSGSWNWTGPFISSAQKVGTDDTYNYYMINSEALYTIAASWKPLVMIRTAANVDSIQAECNVAGMTTP